MRISRCGLIVVALACGTAPHRIEPTHPPPAHETAPLLVEMDRSERALNDVTAVAARIDCKQACDLASSICALAEKICDIAARNPRSSEARDRCDDGRARCRRARERVAMRCRCG